MKEITLKELNPREFIAEKIKEISSKVGDGLAINALSGGVDSSCGIAQRLVIEVPGVVSVTYNIAKKPPSTMEVV